VGECVDVSEHGWECDDDGNVEGSQQQLVILQECLLVCFLVLVKMMTLPPVVVLLEKLLHLFQVMMPPLDYPLLAGEVVAVYRKRSTALVAEEVAAVGPVLR